MQKFNDSHSIQLCDSHAHLTMPDVLLKIDEIIEHAKAAFVTKIVNICLNPDSLLAGWKAQEKYPFICNAGATPPHDVEKDGEKDYEFFAKAAREKTIMAIGETGLDYYYHLSSAHVQRQFFIRYLHLAAACQLPVIIHCREAFDDVFSIVDGEYPKTCPVILHCFTGNVQDASRALERGWMISLSGIITFPKSEELRSIVRSLPIESIMLETDTPYLSPQSKRGKPNEPSNILEIAKCLADLKELSITEVAKSTYENAKRVFQF